MYLLTLLHKTSQSYLPALLALTAVTSCQQVAACGVRAAWEGHATPMGIMLSQMLGDNVLGALLETATALAAQQQRPLAASDAEGSVYFDVLSSVMVRHWQNSEASKHKACCKNGQLTPEETALRCTVGLHILRAAAKFKAFMAAVSVLHALFCLHSGTYQQAMRAGEVPQAPRPAAALPAAAARTGSHPGAAAPLQGRVEPAQRSGAGRSPVARRRRCRHCRACCCRGSPRMGHRCLHTSVSAVRCMSSDQHCLVPR